MPQISDGPYKEHLENCKNAKSIKRRCPRCLFGNDNFNLTDHLKEVPKCQISCFHCGEYFFSMKQRNSHARNCSGHHISCRHCLQVFDPPNMVPKYVLHLDQKQCLMKHKCDDCGKTFTGPNCTENFQKHAKSCDSEDINHCIVCRTLVVGMCDEKKHKVFKCSTCTYSTLFKHHFKRHVCPRPTGERNCAYCALEKTPDHDQVCLSVAKCLVEGCDYESIVGGDRNAENLETHMKNHHKRAPRRCTTCGEHFTCTRTVHRLNCQSVMKCPLSNLCQFEVNSGRKNLHCMEKHFEVCQYNDDETEPANDVVETPEVNNAGNYLELNFYLSVISLQ